MAALGQGKQQVKSHRVQLPEVHDHLVEAEIRIRGQEVPAVYPGSPNRSANVGRLEETLVDDELGFVDDGDRGVCSLSICEIAGLGQNQYPVDGDVDSRRVLAIEVEFPDGKDETVINQIPLIQEGIRSR